MSYDITIENDNFAHPVLCNDGVHDGLGVHGYACSACDYLMVGWTSSPKASLAAINSLEKCPNCQRTIVKENVGEYGMPPIDLEGTFPDPSTILKFF